jgi:hypothetical protein
LRRREVPNGLSRFSVRLWFCLAVSVIAAAIADPVVEYASNSGWFGPGNFTDHSNLDVLPVLLAGLVFAGLHVALRIRAALTRPAPAPNLLRDSDDALGSSFPGLLPVAYGLQILVLYAMETCEQFAVSGHGSGGTLWLGGPVFVGLFAHAVTCVLACFLGARVVRTLARTTLRVLRIVRALATFPARAPAAIVYRGRACVPYDRSAPLLCRIGERAPPLLPA